MTRTSAKFLIVSSSTGRIISNCRDIRRKYGDGPYIKVHIDSQKVVSKDVVGLAQLKDDNTINLPWSDGNTYKLFVPDDLPASATDPSGNLRVVLVEASSYDNVTTAKLIGDLWEVAIHQPQVFKEYVSVTSGNDKHKAGIVAMIIGKKGTNVRRIADKKGKIYTKREENPFLFVIESFSAKNAAFIKIQLTKEIQKIQDRRQQKKRARVSEPAPTKQSVFGSFALLAADDCESDDENPPLDGTTPPLHFASGAGVYGRAGAVPVAQMLEDSAARGETFSVSESLKKKRDEENIRMLKKNIDQDDDTQRLSLATEHPDIADMTTAQLFNLNTELPAVEKKLKADIAAMTTAQLFNLNTELPNFDVSDWGSDEDED
jgi:hypothetical protein